MNPQNELLLIETLREIRTLLVAVRERMDDTVEARGMIFRLESSIQAHEARINKAEEELEDTGSVYVNDLKSKLANLEGSQTHWVRYVIAALVALAMVFISSGLGYILHK